MKRVAQKALKDKKKDGGVGRTEQNVTHASSSFQKEDTPEYVYFGGGGKGSKEH